MGSFTAIPQTAISILSQIRDIFSGKTTDENGEVELTLTRTPTSIENISVLTGNTGFVATAKALVSKTLTLQVRKMKYDKATSTTGNLIGLPSGVTEQSTKQNTDYKSLPSSNFGGEGSGEIVTGNGNHNHGVSFEYSHNHNIATTETDMPLANSEANLNFTVIYN